MILKNKNKKVISINNNYIVIFQKKKNQNIVPLSDKN